jgi:PAS domain S-box-containing protein
MDHVAAHLFWDIFQIEEEMVAERKRAEDELRASIERMEIAYEQSIIYARQLKEQIAERKRVEEAVRESEERYRRITEAVTDYIFTVRIEDGHPVETVHGPACVAVTGYTPEDFASDPFLWIRMVHEADRQSVQKQAGGVLSRQDVPPIEHRILRKDGVIRWVTNTLVPNYDTQGNLLSYDGLIRDIHERKEAEEARAKLEVQLSHAQKMEAIGTLSGGIAHDFNNLLMGIQGNISLMLMDIDSTHPYYERLKKIENQVQSGARLTSHLLGYARKGRYQIKPINLNQLVKELSVTFGRTRKQISIHLGLAADLLAVEADQGQIEQVVLNLYVNAADAMPGGGDLILKTMNVTHKDMKGKLYDPKPGNYVLLMVSDTGTGMDEKDMKRIFDPFFTTKEMGRGTGLGLASAYGIIKGHGGYIDVESKKGHGTTFNIYLPATEKKVERTVKAAEQIIEGTGTILLVDDEAMVLDVGVMLLERLGYTVLQAKGGREAVGVYKQNQDKIDIVILDMIMPDMGGGETYDKMKVINPNVKVLLSSGYSIDGQAKEILARGCDGFIQKPFTMKDLTQSIREILGKE